LPREEAMTMPIHRDDPYAAFNFRVHFPAVGIDGAAVSGGFSEVSGLDTEVTVIEYRNGNDRSLAPCRLPGLVRHADIVLRRGLIGDPSLWHWCEQSLRGRPQRASGRIELLDETSDQVVMAWRVHDAWPTRFIGPTLNGNSGAIAVEELRLAHQGIEIDD
jgi:phage tail-like protein